MTSAHFIPREGYHLQPSQEMSSNFLLEKSKPTSHVKHLYNQLHLQMFFHPVYAIIKRVLNWLITDTLLFRNQLNIEAILSTYHIFSAPI